MITRKNRRKMNGLTRKKWKGGVNKMLLNKKENVIEQYKSKSKFIRSNKDFILSCMFQLKDNPEELRELYKLIPKPMKKQYDIVKKYLYYAPLFIKDIPKPLQKKEYAWLIAMKRDREVFSLLSKPVQKDILDNHSHLLNNNTNVNFNMSGNILFDLNNSFKNFLKKKK